MCVCQCLLILSSRESTVQDQSKQSKTYSHPKALCNCVIYQEYQTPQSCNIHNWNSATLWEQLQHIIHKSSSRLFWESKPQRPQCTKVQSLSPNIFEDMNASSNNNSSRIACSIMLSFQTSGSRLIHYPHPKTTHCNMKSLISKYNTRLCFFEFPRIPNPSDIKFKL